jgi:prevent-host-death family protein
MPTIAEARQTFTDLLGRAHYKGERIDITRRHTPYATIVSVEDKEKLEAIDKLLREWKCANLDELRERLKAAKSERK